MPRGNSARIVNYDAAFGDAFARLNREWLEKYFWVEPVDEALFVDPMATVIQPGGVILYAILADEVVGTVALKRHPGGVFELTKMAVTAACQGMGLGRDLLSAAVAKFQQLDGVSMYLESHSSLTVALALYESAGFRHTMRPKPSDYERSDVYMVYHAAVAKTA